MIVMLLTIDVANKRFVLVVEQQAVKLWFLLLMFLKCTIVT
jgi:hypothetical protein